MTAARASLSIRPRVVRGPGSARADRAWAIVALLVAASVATAGAVAITATDATIAQLAARPSASDPGPLLYSTSDGLVFSSSGSTEDLAWYADFTAATNNASASSATIQGQSHTFTDWLYAMQGTGSKFTRIKATGVYDANAGAYTVPLLFTRSSQGTLVLSWFSAASPAANPSSTTFYWAYDSVTNRYVIGTSQNLASETQIAPVSDTLGVVYTRTLETNVFVVAAVGSGPNYLPTVQQGRSLTLLSHPHSTTWYVLMDTPAGVHEDTYSFTLRTTALST